MANEATPITKGKKAAGATGIVRHSPVLAMRRDDPPLPTGGRGTRSQYDEARRTCQQDPGKWYLLIESAKHAGAGADAMRRRGCEVTVRRNDDGTWRIWAMWPANGDSAQ